MATRLKKKHAAPSPPHKRILEHAGFGLLGGFKSEKLLPGPVKAHVFFFFFLSLTTPPRPAPQAVSFWMVLL